MGYLHNRMKQISSSRPVREPDDAKRSSSANFMEPSAILVIMAPTPFPIAMQLGIDSIPPGIIMVVNMEIGMIMPPWG